MAQDQPGGGERATRPRVPTTPYGGRLTGDGALVTKVLIAANVVVFLAAHYLYRSMAGDDYHVGSWDMFSAVAPDGTRYGVAAGPGGWYRLLTGMFMHQGWVHLGSNMLALWWLGPALERALGRLRFLALYLVSGLAGNALVFLLSGDAARSVGASGAVFGVFGATAVLLRAARQPLGPVVALIAVNLVITFSVPGIDWRAHVGGLAAGMLTGAGMVHAPRANRDLVQAGTVVLMLAVVLGTVLVGTARLAG
ncbi:rhomboid family intramembrane serine protease [Streptomyces tateyamensis]|uniref:Rhomboid family intramembrane serine protease n=1 Tax=Streptomyces tateyamensis TaxID=565073 RepID=A0A2V4P9G8_9ACTN|nr:rhomboid family intramembrane serine protease [Streptomyces tateyamensis]PYC87545.1 rhomboid family intramembrane serine protease [Streptomyces tateyamensis]